MFNTLRWRLTLLYSLVFVLILICLGISMNLVLKNQLIRTGGQTLDAISANILTGRVNEIMLPRQLPSGQLIPKPFFFRISNNGRILLPPDSPPLSNPAYWQALVQSAHDTGQSQGYLQMGAEELLFDIAYNPSTEEFLYVFQSFAPYRSALNSLQNVFILASIGGLFLSLIAGFFLAHRTLLPLRISWQQQKNFIADMSHEFRTPLAVLRANLDIVLSSPGQSVGSQFQWLHHMDMEIRRLARQVDSFLLMARIEAHQQLLAKQPFLLSDSITATCEHFLSLAASKNIHLLYLITPHLFINGDSGRVSQLLTLLLDNALRHTPPDGQVTVSLVTENNEAILTVHDTGEGIPPQELPHIFQRFYQSKTTRSNGGAGLGLAIARWIAENHGGSIHATSQPYDGATFIVYLPLCQAPVASGPVPTK